MSDEQRSAQLASLRIVRPDEGPAVASESHLQFKSIALGAIGGAVVAGTLVWLLLGRNAKEQTQDESTRANPASESANGATAAALAPLSSGSLVASGYVVARRRATVAAEITGRVAEVLVEEGMVVAKGQLLARLDATLAATDLATAQSRTASAQAAARAAAAELTDAERILQRTQNLATAHLASEADLTRVETRVVSLTAERARFDADAATARSDARRAAELLAKHRIVAPFAGVVVDKNAQPGEIISPVSAGGGFTRTGICTLVDMDSLEIEVDVNEAYISRVSPDQAVKATLDAYPDWRIPARVIATVPTANRDKATVRVRIALLAKDPRILPDMAIKVVFAEKPSG
jgi:RND family efflux transporter MFP subunit